MNPFVEILLATIIWGLSGVFIKTLGLSPGLTSFFRTATPTVVLLFYLLYRRRKIFRKDAKFMIMASGLNAVRIYLYVYGILLTTIGNAVILAYTWPIFTTMFSSFIGEKLDRGKLKFLFLAFLGIILVYLDKDLSLSSSNFLGMAAILVSTIIYSVTVIMYKHESKRYSRTETVFYQNLVGAFVFLPFIFSSNLPTIRQFGLALLYGLSIGIVAFVLFFSALKKLDASVASIISYLEVIWALIYSMLFFGEIITWNMIAGGMLIIAAAYAMTRTTPSTIE